MNDLMRRLTSRVDRTLWSRNLLLLAGAVFLIRFGEGLYSASRTNLFVDTLGLASRQILWLEGIREIPGLLLILLSALVMHLPLSRRGAAAILIMGLGFVSFAVVRSYAAVLAVEIAASVGDHTWMPLHSTLGMSLAPREESGRVMGTLGAVAALAAIFGMGSVALMTKVADAIPLRAYFVLGGVLMLLAASLLWRLPPRLGRTTVAPRRLLISRRYWHYYVLNFFEGSRKQVLGAFATLVLVQSFRLQTWQISLLLLASAAVNFSAAPSLGRALDRFGERTTLGVSYVLLIGACLAYATARQVWILAILFVLIKLLVVLEMGLATYVNRIAPREELTPTLSAGISVNHITSVGMPLLAGVLYPIIGYPGIFLGAAGMIALSLPFVFTLHVARAREGVPEGAPAE